MSPDSRLMTVVGDNLDGLLVDSQSGKVQEVFHLKFFFKSMKLVSLFFPERNYVAFKTGKCIKN
jgi:hypothetical protein